MFPSLEELFVSYRTEKEIHAAYTLNIIRRNPGILNGIRKFSAINRNIEDIDVDGYQTLFELPFYHSLT